MGQMKDPDLYSVVFGESVLNDAVAIVLYTVFSEFTTDTTAEPPSFGSAVQLFFFVLCGSLGLGVGVGLVSAVLTKHIHKLREEPHFEVALMWLFAYGSYVVADACGLSGIVSLFFCAIVMSHYTKYNISQNSQIITVSGFKTIAFMAEAAIFAYLGVDLFFMDWASVPWLWVIFVMWACFVGRSLNVVPLSFLLNLCRRSARSRWKQRRGASSVYTGREPIPAKSQFLIWCAHA